MPRTALLVMDVQQGIVHRYVDNAGYLPGLRRAIDAAHRAGIPVIYVRVGFRDGHPEVSPRNKAFANAAVRRSGFGETDPAAAVHPDIAPAPGDIVVTKRRV